MFFSPLSLSVTFRIFGATQNDKFKQISLTYLAYLRCICLISTRPIRDLYEDWQNIFTRKIGDPSSFWACNFVRLRVIWKVHVSTTTRDRHLSLWGFIGAGRNFKLAVTALPQAWASRKNVTLTRFQLPSEQKLIIISR